MVVMSQYAARLGLDARQQRCSCSTAQRSTFGSVPVQRVAFVP